MTTANKSCEACQGTGYIANATCELCGGVGAVLDKSSPEALTAERKNQHGEWFRQAEIANRLKEQLRNSPNWDGMVPMQKEALDMIATKMSRIVSGDPMHEDHWDDIAGYAFLGKGGHKL